MLAVKVALYDAVLRYYTEHKQAREELRLCDLFETPRHILLLSTGTGESRYWTDSKIFRDKISNYGLLEATLDIPFKLDTINPHV